MSYKFFPLFFVLLLTSFTSVSNKTISKEITVSAEAKTVSRNASLYSELNSNSFTLPNFDVLSTALDGFYLLKQKGHVQKDILTLVDFSLSSNTKRLWVIDLEKKVVLFQTLVAHGRNTGEEFAKEFSNQAESFKSAVGFYATGEIYKGKHGLSLKLDGLEKGLNDNARNRKIVIHASDYVSEDFILKKNRLGQSLGCPALPKELTPKIINTIKNKSCLFIYHPSLN